MRIDQEFAAARTFATTNHINRVARRCQIGKVRLRSGQTVFHQPIPMIPSTIWRDDKTVPWYEKPGPYWMQGPWCLLPATHQGGR